MKKNKNKSNTKKNNINNTNAHAKATATANANAHANAIAKLPNHHANERTCRQASGRTANETVQFVSERVRVAKGGNLYAGCMKDV